MAKHMPKILMGVTGFLSMKREKLITTILFVELATA